MAKTSNTIDVSDLHNAVRGLPPVRGIVRESLVLADGTKLSIQASAFHYSLPRQDNLSAYSSYEVAIIDPEGGLKYDPDAPFAANADMQENGCVYGYVLPEYIVEYINNRGGLA